MVRNSNIDNYDNLNTNIENNNNSNNNNNNDSGNSSEIETNNNIAFKRMKITSETDQEINISQSSTEMDNNSNNNESSKPVLQDDDSDDIIINPTSINESTTLIDSHSTANSFNPMNNKAISNSRDDMYQATPDKPPTIFDIDNNNSDDDLPPSYSDLYPTTIHTKSHIPGTNGLNNLGNTCFMNSGLQCIAHTTLLRDYLLKGYWKKELNLTSIHGMKGKMVKAFVKVLENLWGDNDGPYRPSEFKSVISKHTPSFEGYHQHDCQEFIASLLDGLHEDINRVPVKKFEEYPDMNNMEDEEAAKTSWDLHIRRENSIIVDLFYGQYRSINICQVCKCKRLNFEPFVYLTLPIPENQEIEVPIHVLLNGKFLDTIRIKVLKSQSILTMKEKICEELKVNNTIHDLDIEVTKDNLEIFQGHDHTMSAYLSNAELVENIQSLESNYYTLFAYISINNFSVSSITNYLPSIKEVPEKNTCINVPVYQQVENAERYSEDDNGFPFLINLPKLSLFEDEEKKIDRRLLGWIVYREIVKYYQQFTEYTIATLDPAVELDQRVYDCLQKIKEEEQALAATTTSSTALVKKSSSSSDSSTSAPSDDKENDTGNDITNILHDDEIDSQQGNASSNNESLSDVQINDSVGEEEEVPLDPSSKNVEMEDEDTLLENTYNATQANKEGVVEATIAETDEAQAENPEDAVENLYPINDGWKVMAKLFDVQLIYTDKLNDSFYAYSYSYNSSRVAMYKTKDNSCQETDPTEIKPYSYSYRHTTEDRSAKVSMNPKDILLVVTWKPALLEFLFGENKFKVFAPKATKQSVNKPESKPISLEECIQEFIKEEILTDENKWFCPECKEDQEAYKKMDIWKAPEILIVHLKRFIQDRRYYSSRKNNVLVKFPIEGLDLTEVIRGPKNEEKYIYNLYAISNHSGSTGGGHYTAYVKNDGHWYDCNDSFVSEVSENSIVTSSAYLLFYERVHAPGKEFQLPDLSDKPDVVDEEEIKFQQQQQLPSHHALSRGMGMGMDMGMPMQMGNTAESSVGHSLSPRVPTTSTSSSSSSSSSPASYHQESFADFDHIDLMYSNTDPLRNVPDLNPTAPMVPTAPTAPTAPMAPMTPMNSMDPMEDTDFSLMDNDTVVGEKDTNPDLMEN